MNIISQASENKNVFTFNKNYFLLTCFLFFIEVIIAKYFEDKIIRPYVGDLLVVILIYCFVRTFLKSAIIPTAICVLLFAYFIEMLQYFKLLDYLGLENSQAAKTIMGSAFEWTDMIAYTVGICIVIIVEKILLRKH